jgi:CheY-like chemotaxis protein
VTNPNRKKNIVFYADDDIDDVQLIDEAFSKYYTTIELITATDGIEAILSLNEMVENGVKPCLIILDINMPKLDGRETLIKIKQIEELQSVPVVLFSTSSQPADEMFANKYNAGFITKPSDFTQLEAIINTFIDHCIDDIKEIIRVKY